MLKEVTNRIAGLDRDGSVKVGDFKADQQDLLKYVFLFDAYYRFADHFDKLIADQQAAGAKPLPVPFAEQVISRLTTRDIPRQLALRYLSSFYQIRRAFYFIDRLGYSTAQAPALAASPAPCRRRTKTNLIDVNGSSPI